MTSDRSAVHALSFVLVDYAVGNNRLVWGEQVKAAGYDSIVQGVAQFMVKMSSKTYTGVGSLTFDPAGEIVVGPLISRHFKVTQGAQLGVYRTSSECKIAQIDHLLRLVLEKRLGWDGRWRPELEMDPVWSYVSLLEIRELVSSCEDMNREQPTYLRHMDDHYDQILVKDDGHLGAIIDWELWVLGSAS